MERPIVDDYFQEYSHDGVVHHFEHSKYEVDLEQYCDELERELALAKAEPFISVGIATHNKMIAERDEKIKVLEKALDKTLQALSSHVICEHYPKGIKEKDWDLCYGDKLPCDGKEVWKQWALQKAEEELKGKL